MPDERPRPGSGPNLNDLRIGQTVKPFLGYLVGTLLLGSALGGMLLDAAAKRAAQQQRVVHVQSSVRLLGTADMALSSASRWLRHPSLSEPGAAFADGPAILDADPAGAVIGPPRDVLAAKIQQGPGPRPLRTTP